MSRPIPENIPEQIRQWALTVRDPRVTRQVKENYVGNMNNLKLFLEAEIKAYDSQKLTK